jgi:hypothetical protein
MLEHWEDSIIKQWCNYFLILAETELEQANERIEAYRKQLNDYELQQRELQPI